MIKEKRQARRRPLRYTAWVALTANQRHGCVVSDVSDTGARIDVQDSKTIPDHFVLMLSSNGAARRFCRVVWRKPTQMGVKFEPRRCRECHAGAESGRRRVSRAGRCSRAGQRRTGQNRLIG